MGALMSLRNRILAGRRIARERLRLVLISDRAGIPPRMLECLKKDLMRVIAEYVEVSEGGPEFTVTTAKGTSALVATIPIKRLKRQWQPPARAAQ